MVRRRGGRGGRRAMPRLAKALLLTAATVAGWISVVRWQERQAAAGDCPVSYVYDGDTVALDCGGREITARIVGLDTPETRDAHCAEELAAGEAATARLREIVAGGAVTYRRRGVDRYGRWLIRLEAAGRDVAQVMIGEGLAVGYAGGTRIDWCRRLGAAR